MGETNSRFEYDKCLNKNLILLYYYDKICTSVVLAGRTHYCIHEDIVGKRFPDVRFQQNEVGAGTISLGIESASNELKFAKIILRP